jgi:hypothetical protein
VTGGALPRRHLYVIRTHHLSTVEMARMLGQARTLRQLGWRDAARDVEANVRRERELQRRRRVNGLAA